MNINEYKTSKFFFFFFLLVTITSYSKSNKFVSNEHMKKKILQSPYKTSLKRSDGVIFYAILFSPNEHMKSQQYRFCNGVKKKIEIKTGDYYIYLYDVSRDYLSPERIQVFKNFKIKMNFTGSSIFTLYNADEQQSDVLIVSQAGCNGNYYEAYSFPRNQRSLKQYTFQDEKKYDRFYGTISKNNKFIKKCLVYRNDGNNVMQKMYLFLSNSPGIIPLKPAI